MSSDDILCLLRDLKIEAKTVEHAAVFTVAGSKAATSEIPGTHCKNLFLNERKGGLWLVVLREDKPLDLRVLANELGSSRLSFASAERLDQALGVQPGAVSPLAAINDVQRRVRIVLDRDLLGRTLLKFHPLVNNRTTALSPEGLLRFLEATGHTPFIVDL